MKLRTGDVHTSFNVFACERIIGKLEEGCQRTGVLPMNLTSGEASVLGCGQHFKRVEYAAGTWREVFVIVQHPKKIDILLFQEKEIDTTQLVNSFSHNSNIVTRCMQDGVNYASENLLNVHPPPRTPVCKYVVCIDD
ncbi:hypothetical protein TNCV_2982631 [Trichonephila clavipes]|nr:hypothetical protein TNCV_2982631 [Trichonephila clavipes]